MRISVIGGSTCTEAEAELAADVGRQIAERGHELVCGGLGGVMAAACRGASAAGGHTIGILPGEYRGVANDDVDTAIATGTGNVRNVMVVMNGDGVVAVDGGTGTLSELGHALDIGPGGRTSRLQSSSPTSRGTRPVVYPSTRPLGRTRKTTAGR